MNLDKALVSDFSNDSGAFASVFQSYYSALCQFAGKYLHDCDEAKDLVSDLFTKLLSERKELNPELNIKSFLYTSVHNACINYLQKKNRQLEGNKELQYLQKDEGNYFREVLDSEVVQQIYEEIEALPEQCRAVFKLLYIDGLSYEEAAKKMGITERTARNQKSLAVKKLKRKIFPNELFAVTAVALSVAAILVLFLLFLFNTWSIH